MPNINVGRNPDPTRVKMLQYRSRINVETSIIMLHVHNNFASSNLANNAGPACWSCNYVRLPTKSHVISRTLIIDIGLLV